MVASTDFMGPLILAAGVACWIWVFIDCWRDPRLDPRIKRRWLLLIGLLPGVGAIIYVMRRRWQYRRDRYPGER
ncbi:phospholipase D-like protein [Thermosporothrix hazakensis]|jgi:hypothetical protein|uniref:Phospholipase D-like protein n=2 Tax=Thermosporothrix TaxID=768650 RepID=A0A326U8I3_THEHA|nr:PLDc N-terminal domain-containing protein [Thermosporothrix hazakensis]PZW29505.1 phospholipase D-like protein [Thermosporothrix hazakensis]BBH85790.1 hypothetical protein KTC_05410 [Thermosporothrix sp. COM3]GCE45781.1 hypothetical protein KTH_06500 [Thermosporothrix hazakensis]